jgi:RES domain-containing protein
MATTREIVTALGGAKAMGSEVKEWRHAPAPDAVKDIGTAFLRSAKASVLEVPSAVVPQESNFVLNPRHPRFGDLAIESAQTFSLDPRLR